MDLIVRNAKEGDRQHSRSLAMSGRALQTLTGGSGRWGTVYRCTKSEKGMDKIGGRGKGKRRKRRIGGNSASETRPP